MGNPRLPPLFCIGGNDTKYNSLITIPQGTTKEEFAREISAVIMDEYEPRLIAGKIKSDYAGLDADEKAAILQKARRLEIAQDDKAPYLSFSGRERLVRKKVEEYLKTADSIVPRGFADFRIKELSDLAGIIADAAAEAYFARREYEEFAEVLNLLVTTRSGEKVLHVCWEKGRVKLYNRFCRDVTEKYEAEFKRFAGRGASDEDLAISAVIAAAPKKIVLHSPPDCPLANAIRQIFGERCTVIE